MINDKWYPLDNAAQIFPMISKKKDTNSFRLSAVLKEKVDNILLEEATRLALMRYQTFKVRLKKGVFWYYLEYNDKEVIVREEDPYFTESNDYKKQNDYLFNITYYGKRISIEIFHALSDGGGGLEFFKTILYHYLLLKGEEIKNEGEILTKEVEELLDESQDSFKYNYKSKTNKIDKENSAYKIKGAVHKHKWVDCIQAIMDVDDLINKCKEYSCTITEFITALITYNIYYTYYLFDNSKKAIKLFVPVNARKYFKSKTLRNFALFIRTNSIYNGDIKLIDVINDVKETFNFELSKERMYARIKSNIKLEKNFFVRFMILPIKTLIVKLFFKLLGTDSNTLSFSNLGKVEMPYEMANHIDRLEFANGASLDARINAALITFNNKAVLTFSSVLIDRSLQANIISMLQKEGIRLVICTNDLEV